MNTQTKPSSGALRAAKAYFDWVTNTHDRTKLAEIIDRESGLAELLEACKAAKKAIDLNDKLMVLEREQAEIDAVKLINAAIAKATNPNADVQQVAPGGRWTEKGTV